jgi:PKHD-type hydroxylase
MLTHLHNILSPAQIAECRSLMADASWIDGRASAGSAAGSVKNNMEVSQLDPKAQKLGEIVVAAMMASPAFVTTALPIRIVPPSFSRYEPGQAYGLHFDSAVMEFRVSGSPIRVRTDLAATLFLSPPDAYEGGELVIEDTFGQSQVKLPAGDMLLYPSSSRHRVAPVTKGQRLVAFFWIQSMVRDDLHRSLLKELDVSIQQINKALPNNQAGLNLLGLYHNLLRLWSET